MTLKTIQGVLLDINEGVALITLNEPDRRNALSPAVLGGINQALREAEADDAARCVVITGAGKAFCGGGDIAGFKDRVESGALPPWLPMSKEPGYGSTIRAMSKPVIAAINGAAVGAGFQMSLMCDIRIASEKARFGCLWIERALDAAGGAAFLLPRSIGLSDAFLMFYTGDMIDARTALEWRIVSKVLPPDELIPYTMELAKRIAKKPTIPIAMNRRLIYRALDTSFEAIAEWQHAQRMICYNTEDHNESSKAFLEKREPKYKGR